MPFDLDTDWLKQHGPLRDDSASGPPSVDDQDALTALPT